MFGMGDSQDDSKGNYLHKQSSVESQGYTLGDSQGQGPPYLAEGKPTKPYQMRILDQNVPTDQERGNGNSSSAERGEFTVIEEAPQDPPPS